MPVTCRADLPPSAKRPGGLAAALAEAVGSLLNEMDDLLLVGRIARAHGNRGLGCEVRDRKARVIGQVTGVEGTMERSRLVVASPEGRDVLIPMVADICVKVDPASRVIVVDPPEGLLDLN